MNPQITVHCIVRNEEKWVWFALQSVCDIAKEVIVYDTGSTDKTVEIIKTIKNKKIKFWEKGEVTAGEMTALRQEQLANTKTEWFLILDGDEIWPEKTKKELVQKLKTAKSNDWGVVVRAWNFTGDVFHVHPESKRYHWPFAPRDYIGWANLRVHRTYTPGLHLHGDYPLEAYCDSKNKPVQNYGPKHLIFLENRYCHATYLKRSDLSSSVLNRKGLRRLEVGKSFPAHVKYPEVFYLKRPGIVMSPWYNMSKAELMTTYFVTFIKTIKRLEIWQKNH